MRVLLAGQRSFGAAALRMLDDRPDVVVVGVVAPVGDRTATLANERALLCHESLSEQLVRGTGAELIVCAHSHAFVGARSGAAARVGAIGFHPSLLPRHRGRDAVRWTIAMGDPVAGGSVYWLTDNVDGGPIAAQEHCLVPPGIDHHQLWRELLFPMGVRLLARAVTDLVAGRMVQQPQDERCATWEPSWDRPPVWRPELPELGGMPDGMTLIRNETAESLAFAGRHL